MHHLLCAGDILPNPERPCAQNPIVGRLQEVAANKKEILNESMEGQEALSLSWGGEPSHRPFLLSGGLVRHFGSVVRIDLVNVIHRGHDRAMCGVIASEFVRD